MVFKTSLEILFMLPKTLYLYFNDNLNNIHAQQMEYYLVVLRITENEKGMANFYEAIFFQIYN